MDYLEGATYIIVFQLLIFSIINIREFRQSHTLLGILMILVAISIKDFWAYYFEDIFIHYLINNSRFDFFYGPFLFLFIRSIIIPLSKKEILKHMIAPTAFFVYTLVGSLMIYYGVIDDPNIGISELRIGLLLFYSIMILRLFQEDQWELNKYTKRYKVLFLSFGVYLTFKYIDVVLYKYYYEFRQGLLPELTYVDAVIYIFLVGFLAYFTATEITWLKRYFLNVKSPSGKNTSSFDQIDEKLNHLFREEKIHRNESLDLAKLAEALGVKRSDLSQFIQIRYKSTFYELINRWRVEEFKENLFNEKYQHLDLLGIAYESGFKSKATFNRAFKKIEGITPREYREQNLKK